MQNIKDFRHNSLKAVTIIIITQVQILRKLVYCRSDRIGKSQVTILSVNLKDVI